MPFHFCFMHNKKLIEDKREESTETKERNVVTLKERCRGRKMVMKLERGLGSLQKGEQRTL